MTDNKEALAVPAASSTLEMIKAMPAGYEVVALGIETKWAVIDAGKPISGRLLARQEMTIYNKKTKMEEVRGYYTIMADTPCLVQIKRENGALENQMCEVGDIVSLGERQKLQVMAEWAADTKNRHYVYLLPTKEIEIGKGMSMWLFSVGHRVLPKPLQTSTDAASDDVPF